MLISPRAAIFDLDDTLVNSTEIAKKNLPTVYANNLHLFPGKNVETVNKVASQIYHKLIYKQHLPIPTADIIVLIEIFKYFHISPLPLTKITKLRQQIDQVFIKNTRATPNAKIILKKLKNKNYKIGVLTNRSFSQQSQKLIKTKLLQYVDYLATIEMFPAAKPDPRAFQYILTQLKIKPNEAIMVGNSLDEDILGAKSIGMKGVLLRTPWEKYFPNDENKADFIITDLKELFNQKIF